MQNVEFNNFTEVNEATHPEKLKPNELAQLDNMVIDDQLGIISTRKGFARYLQPDSTGVINNLFDVQDANQNNYLLANVGTKLRKYFSSTWTDIKTGLTAAKMRMAVYGASFIFTNGVDKPFYTDLTNTYSGDIERPDLSSMYYTINSGADNFNGIYRYIMVYVIKDGQNSNPSVPYETFLIVGTSNESLLLLNLPVPTDARIVTKQLYRTLKSSFVNYYLVASLDVATTSFLDNVTDANLDTTQTIEYLATINTAKYISAVSDRVLLANLSKVLTNRVLQPPYVPPDNSRIVSETTGLIENGSYQWAVSFVDKLGNESALTLLATYTITDGPIGIILTAFSLPRIDNLGDMDDSIKFLRFYRTHKNETTVYYYVGDFIIIPTSIVDPSVFTDALADASLTVTYEVKSAPHNAVEISDLPSSVVFSDLYNYSQFPELNYLEVFPDDSDSITGIFDDDNGIMVFKENSICKIYTNGSPENWQIMKLVHNIGCDQPDSIFKYGNTYFFVFRNKVYEWAGSGEPKCISYKRKPTFDSVTSFQGAAFYNSVLWYVLTVKISSTYYLLCYDTKLETWYKFSINQADTVLEKVFGTDKGKLLFGGNLYITYLSSQVYDSDSGTKKDITIALKTKDYSFPDNFITARLMFLMINYYRLIGTVSKQITFALTDPVSGISISLTDWDETIAQNIFKIVTDGMQGDLKRTFKINLSISGEAISKFFAGRLDYNVEQWRVLQKTLVHKAVDDSGKYATDDTDRPASDDGGGISVF